MSWGLRLTVGVAAEVGTSPVLVTFRGERLYPSETPDRNTPVAEPRHVLSGTSPPLPVSKVAPMKYRSRYASPVPAPAPALPGEGHSRRTHPHRSTARRSPLPPRADTPVRLALRAVAGIVFITLGQMKFFDSILLGTEAVSLPTGPEGFSLYLTALGVPFPLLTAYLVCWVEMICGLGLILSAFLPAPALLTRLCALPLAGDMTVATLTVGLRNILGHPVLLDGIPVTHQPWRFPLEFALLSITVLLLWRPLPRGTPAPAPA